MALFSQQFGQGVRESSDSIDELVKRNIQEVLQAVQQDDEPGMPQRYAADRQAENTAGTSRPTSARPSRPTSGTERQSVGGAEAAGISNSTSMLDVPGHAEATIRLHKARIKTLEDDVQKMSKSLTDKERQLSEALKELKGLKAEQAGWAKDKKALETQVERLQKKLSDTESVLNSKEQAVKEINKESSKAEKERRNAELEARSRDVRLQRALEEVEKYKAMIQELKLQERDGKDVVKADLNRLATENKKLERQRAELLVAFKKQLKLIDVLKRQKVHLEAARALQFTESEFLQTLELGNA